MWVRTRKIVRALSLRHWKPTPLDGLDAKNSLIYTGGEVRGLTDKFKDTAFAVIPKKTARTWLCN